MLESLLAAQPKAPDAPDALALRAAGPGLVMSAGVALLGECRDTPDRANPLMRSLAWRDRRLGSHDRRIIKAALVGVMRHGAAAELLLRQGGWSGERWPEALWLALLVWEAGVPLELAEQSFGAPVFGAFADPIGALRQAVEGWPKARTLGLLASQPEWLAERWIEQFGEEEAARLACAQNERGPLSLRANRLRISPEGLIAKLAEEKIQAKPGRWAPDAVEAIGPANLLATRAFRQGLFEMQDEGSQLIAELVAVPRGGLVVDLCAGSGGKTLAIAAKLPKGARIWALDVRDIALDEAAERLRRAGIEGVRLDRLDPKAPLPVAPESAAVVLVDAPCSGSGTLRRNPALRWRLTPEMVEELHATQRTLLAKAAGLVRAGGRVVYATCSLFTRENEEVIDAFIAENPGWSIIPVKERLGAGRAEAVSRGPYLGMLPQVHGSDGFFAAILQRER